MPRLHHLCLREGDLLQRALLDLLTARRGRTWLGSLRCRAHSEEVIFATDVECSLRKLNGSR